MRSRPALELHVSPDPPTAGDAVEVTLAIDSRSETPCDRITIELVGEYLAFEAVRERRTTSWVDVEREHLRLRATLEGRVLTVGEHVERVTFRLPTTALPTHRSKRFGVRYRLSAQVDIPLWPDANVSRHVVVRPRPTEVERGSAIHRSSHRAPTGRDLFVEASIGGAELVAGEEVEIAAALGNVDHHRVTSIDFVLVTIESPVFMPEKAPEAVAESVLASRAGAPGEGEVVRARLRIPEDVEVDVLTDYFRITHELRVVVRVARASDRTLAIPIAVRRSVGDAPPLARPIPVGVERQIVHWQKACATLGRADARLDAGDGTGFTLAVGDRTIRVAETRREGAPFLEATLSWPSLGIALHAETRGWAMVGGLDVDAALTAKTRVVARREAQARALFDTSLVEAALAFDAIDWRDEGGTAAIAGGARSLPTLARFLRAVVALDARMGDAFARIPTPVEIAHARPAFEAFARERRARLHPGDLAITELGSAAVPLDVQHVIDGASRGTVVMGGPLEDASIPASLVERLAYALGHPAELGADGRIRVRVPFADDPRALTPILDGVHDALAALKKTSGPYR